MDFDENPDKIARIRKLILVREMTTPMTRLVIPTEWRMLRSHAMARRRRA
jgi:hypothetical protein